MMFSELRSFEGGRNAGVAAPARVTWCGPPAWRFGGPAAAAAAAAAALIVAHFPRTTVKYLSYIYGNPSNIFSSCLDISACLLGVPSLQAKGETVVSG